jgi:Cu(I)/Ag(I) efflux system membrane fusion protein
MNRNCGFQIADCGLTRKSVPFLLAFCIAGLPSFVSVAASAQEHAGHQQVGQGTVQQKTEPVAPAANGQQAATTVVLSPDKVQLIGVRTAIASTRSLERRIRTVGKMEPDERRLAFVNTKIAGWVKKLYVSFTGEPVVKGQPLLSIYSPDLVTAQEEYLLALRAIQSSPHHDHEGLEEIDASRKGLLDSARQRLLLWDITQQQIDELERTGKTQTDMIIEAPLSGIVLEKMVLDGGYITQGMNLYKIADLSSVWIMADVYEYEVQLVKIGQEARVTLPYSTGEAIQATVNYINPVLDPVSRTVKVRLVVKNPGLALKPEMFANVEIMVSSGARLVIPREAVLFSGLRQIVYVEKKPGVYEKRRVTLGQQGDDYVEVLKGIKKGERVVTSGNFLIDSESQFRSGGEN